MMIEISVAEPKHSLLIADLFHEMDAFYGERENEATEIKAAHINSALFSDPPFAFSLLAWDQERLVGFACYSFLWPAAGSSKSLFLKELYVRETRRKSGIGSLLMREIFRVAKENSCSRVEWMTERENIGARRFYEKLDTSEVRSKIFYRVEGQASIEKIVSDA